MYEREHLDDPRTSQLENPAPETPLKPHFVKVYRLLERFDPTL